VKLTRQRKISVAVLSLAVMALAADRLFIGPSVLSPSGASAATTEAEAAPTPRAAVLPVISVAERLEALRPGAAGLLDAFEPPAPWRTETLSAPRAKATPADTTPVPRLTGVFTSASGGRAEAIIEKQRVREGDEVEGWRVEKIRSGRTGETPGVLLVRGERREELTTEPVFSNPRSVVAPKTVGVRSAATTEDGGRR